MVVSDLFGVSGRAIMAALSVGECDPAGAGRPRPRHDAVQDGAPERGADRPVVDHHAFLLERMLHRVDALTAEIATVQSRIDARVAALADTVTPLDAIPGVAQSPRRRSWPRPGSTWAGSRPGRLDSAGDLHHLERLRPARAGADRG